MVDLNSIKQSDFWYFIGLLVTDGNLSNDGRHINLTSKDIDHLEKLKSVLGLHSKLTLKARGGRLAEKKYGFLQFSDVALYKYLLSIGLSQKKSLTIGAVKVPRPYFTDFLRGIIDGDGSIRRWIHASNAHEQWSLSVVSGSRLFLEWLNVEINAVLGITARLHVSKAGLYLLKFGKMKAQKIMKACYYKGALALERKAVLAGVCLQDNKIIRSYTARVV